MKKTIKMNERELHKLISESVKRVLREEVDDIGDEWSYEEAVEQLQNIISVYLDSLMTHDPNYRNSLSMIRDTCKWLLNMFPDADINEIIEKEINKNFMEMKDFFIREEKVIKRYVGLEK